MLHTENVPHFVYVKLIWKFITLTMIKNFIIKFMLNPSRFGDITLKHFLFMWFD